MARESRARASASTATACSKLASAALSSAATTALAVSTSFRCPVESDTGWPWRCSLGARTRSTSNRAASREASAWRTFAMARSSRRRSASVSKRPSRAPAATGSPRPTNRSARRPSKGAGIGVWTARTTTPMSPPWSAGSESDGNSWLGGETFSMPARERMSSDSGIGPQPYSSGSASPRARQRAPPWRALILFAESVSDRNSGPRHRQAVPGSGSPSRSRAHSRDYTVSVSRPRPLPDGGRQRISKSSSEAAARPPLPRSSRRTKTV